MNKIDHCEIQTFTLNNDYTYRTSITVYGQSLNLFFAWNSRLNLRVLNITNSEGVCYLDNTALRPNQSYKLNNNAVLSGFDVSVTLVNISPYNDESLVEWSENYLIGFVRLIEERL